jgi:short-subunit dehydrogenase
VHRFASQTIVVTGASAGIGRALALALSPEKPRLVLAARNVERLSAVAAECQALGAETLVVPTDVTDSAQCRAMAEQTIGRFGSLDVLVNNAGGAMWSRFDELADTGPLENVMRLNYLGSVYATFHALPHLRRAKGRLVALASIAGMTGVPMLSGYVASKHAVIGFFESLRIELAEAGVSVTIVAPDWVQSEILDRSLDAQGRPLGHSPLDQNAMMNTDRCAQRIKRAMARRERLVLMSGRAKSLRWGKILMPGLVDRITAASLAAMGKRK